MAPKKPVVAPKPAAPKTSYKIPAVIAKPSAPAPATKSSGAAPKGGGKAATGSKLIQPIKTPIKTSGGTSSLDKQFAEGMKQIQKDKEELKKLLEQYNKNKKDEDSGGEEDGGKEEASGGGEDPS